MRTRVVVADDHAIMRDGLRSLLSDEPDMEVVGEAEDGRAALALCKELGPDVVVMDVGLPGLNGIEATRQIARECPTVKVLALSTYRDARYAAGMVEAGASGYVVKSDAFDQLSTAIRAVVRGDGYLSPGVASAVMQDYATRLEKADALPASVLTDREREVLQLIAEGKTNREIAAVLFVSPKTVDSHRQHIMEKLGLHSIAELTKYALRAGLTPP